jgi:hypothetical protein
MTNLKPEAEEFTPEQRRLLAEAYWLILSWKRDGPDPKSSSSDMQENIETGKHVKQPDEQVHDLPDKKQGGRSRV